ncbi:MAG: protein kinase [Planctomycetaceae bacterium]
MDTPPIVGEFLELLKQCDLLPSGRYADIVAGLELDAEESAETVAKTLIRRGLLTRFQAERLLTGRSRGFFYGPYKLLEIIGCGGMSRVFLAEDATTGEQIALKALAERYEHDAGMFARLKLESFVGKKVRHPNVLHTRRLGDAAGAPFLVMEHVEGIELQELIETGGPVPFAQACDIIRQTAIGLHAAHQTGIVHRDVKPANIIIDRGGGVKILDFGLALLGEDAAADEFSLQMIFGHDCLGTAFYMPPEQSTDSNAVDARADIYSLGCTLYHALTGTVPFPLGDSGMASAVARVIESQRTQRAPAIHSLVKDVPDAVVAIVERMMQKRPADRFASAAVVAEALGPYSQRTAIEADLDEVLSARILRARRRVAAETSVRGRSSIHGSSVRGISEAGSRTRDSRLTVETAVNHDTRPENPSRIPPVRRPPETSIERDAAANTGRRHAAASTLDEPAFLITSGGGDPIVLDAPRVVIGRDADCDVVLATHQISGRHCELRYESGRWRVVDLGSKNGITVNGRKVGEAVLKSRDRLTVGQYVPFQFQATETGSTGRLAVWALAAVGLAGTVAAIWWYLFQ